MWDLLSGALRVAVTVVLGLYLLITFQGLFGGVRVALTHQPRLDPDNPEIDVAFRQLVARPPYPTVMGLLFTFGAQLAWPVLLKVHRTQVRRPGDRRLRVPIASTPPHRSIAAAVLVLAAVVALLWNARLSYSPVLIFISALALASIICRHVSYLIVPLNQQQRRSGDSPWLALVLVALLDAAALCVVVTDLRALWRAVPFDAVLLRQTAIDIFDVPRNLGSWLDLGPARLLLACAGLLWAAVVIQSLLAPSQFRRTDDDRRALAFESAAAGDATRALHWLSEEQQSDVSSYRLRAQIGLVSGDLDGAYEAAGRLLASSGEADTPDRRLITVVHVSPLAPMQDDDVLALAQLVVERGTGLCAATLLPSLVQQYPNSVAGLQALLARSDRPMAFARVLELANELEHAEQVWEAVSPASNAEELLRRVRLEILKIVIARLDLPDLQNDLATWPTTLIPEITRLAEGLDEEESRSAAGPLIELEFCVEMVALQGGDASSFSTLRHELRGLSVALAEDPREPEILLSTLRGAVHGGYG